MGYERVGAGAGGAQRIPRPEQWAAGADAPWAAIEPERRAIDLEGIRAGLAGHATGDVFTGAPPPRRDSAVLIPLIEASDGQLSVILTRRTQKLRAHSGEISFPGGGQDPGETLWETALREAHEEIALPSAQVREIGELNRLVTFSSNTKIHPFVALAEGDLDLAASADEVDRILIVELATLTSDGVFREEVWEHEAFPEPRPITYFDLDGDTVWGATAAMLRELLCVALGLPTSRY